MLGAIRDGLWYWELGDPDPGSLIVTAAYFLVSICCGAAGRYSVGRKQSAFWYLFALLLFALGVNKQADLQSLVTLLGRDIAQDMGFYQVRRNLQFIFVVALAGSAALSIGFGLWRIRRWALCYWIAVVGLAVQATFVVGRAASFHHVSTNLTIASGELKLRLLFESLGLALIMVGAVYSICPRRAHLKA